MLVHLFDGGSLSEPAHAEKDILWLRKNLEEGLYRVFKASFPFFSYKEVKNLVKAQYYRLIVELREAYSWEELEARMATTQQGLRKLGDVTTPRLLDNEIRTVLHLVQQAGAQGLELSALAASFYKERGSRPGRLSLDEALSCLLETHDIIERRDRYFAGVPELDLSTEIIRSILVILQTHPEGLTLDALAGAYYAQGRRLSGNFEEALESLLKVGDVLEESGVLRATASVQSYTREGGVPVEVAMSIVHTAGRIGDVVARGTGQKTAGLWRVTLAVPDGVDAGQDFLRKLREALGKVVDEAEASEASESKQRYTVILGAAPSIL